MTQHHTIPQHSDLICVLLGASVLFIFRKKDDFFVVVSDAYVAGLMFGEAIELMRRGDLAVKTIDLH